MPSQDFYKRVKAKLEKKINKEEQLAKGKEIEREHEKTIKFLLSEAGLDPDSEKGKELLEKSFEMIALDHTKEIPDYYLPWLVNMEEKAKKSK